MVVAKALCSQPCQGSVCAGFRPPTASRWSLRIGPDRLHPPCIPFAGEVLSRFRACCRLKDSVLYYRTSRMRLYSGYHRPGKTAGKSEIPYGHREFRRFPPRFTIADNMDPSSARHPSIAHNHILSPQDQGDDLEVDDTILSIAVRYHLQSCNVTYFGRIFSSSDLRD